MSVLMPATFLLFFFLGGLALSMQTSEQGWSWWAGSPVMAPGPAGSFDETSVKDPSIVFHEGEWHLFFTARGLGRASTGYARASTLEALGAARRHELLQTGVRESGYACAPQVFFFEPQGLWYLVFQIHTGKRTHSPFFMTTKTLRDPTSWSAPQPLVSMDEDAKWIDFWLICDEERAFLFYTRNHKDVCFRTTRLADFPQGFGSPSTAFSDVHEAVHIYKVRGEQRFDMIYEYRVEGDVRAFGLAQAGRLQGPWKTVDPRFATGPSLRFPEGVPSWTDEVSHGEAIRSGIDQRLEIEPGPMLLLIQGIGTEQHQGEYARLPWRMGIIAGSPSDPPDPAGWSKEEAWDWHRTEDPVKGCNYLPRTAVNVTEMWNRDTFDETVIDQELAWGEKAGLNSLRVFLQYICWRDDPQGFLDRVDRFLGLAARHGMTVMPVLFCDCSFANKEPYPGPQDPPVPGVHNSGWVPSPGLERVGDRSHWPDLRRYVRSVVERFSEDSRILCWDLYNEPGNSKMGDKSLPLSEAAFRWARSVRPRQPLTVGVWSDPEGEMSQRLFELSDLVSFHCYGPAETVEKTLLLCAEEGRPLLCTECLHRNAGNVLEAFLPLFREHKVGWYVWGLVAGKTQTYMPWGSQPGDPTPEVWQHDLFHASGTPYSERELELIREWSFP